MELRHRNLWMMESRHHLPVFRAMELTDRDEELKKGACRLATQYLPNKGSVAEADPYSDEDRAGLLDDTEGSKEVSTSSTAETSVQAILQVEVILRVINSSERIRAYYTSLTTIYSAQLIFIV